jgi:hypothetical protein
VLSLRLYCIFNRVLIPSSERSTEHDIAVRDTVLVDKGKSANFFFFFFLDVAKESRLVYSKDLVIKKESHQHQHVHSAPFCFLCLGELVGAFDMVD